MKIGSFTKEMDEVVDSGYNLMEELEVTKRSTNGHGNEVGYRKGYGHEVELNRFRYRGARDKDAGT